jgi:hypothetical protein
MSGLFPSNDVPSSALKFGDNDEAFTSAVTFGELDMIGEKFIDDVVLTGYSIIYINRVEEVCCGAVGSAGKVCLK